MDIEYLHEFVELSRIGSYTRTATRLGISRTTLSKHVCALEREFRLTLFERDNLHTELTPEGRLLLKDAQLLLGTWGSMHEHADELRRTQRLKLRIGLFKGHKPTDDLVEIATRNLQRKNPLIDVVVEDIALPCFQALREGVVDLISPVHADDTDLEGLDETLLMEEPLIAIVPINHPLASKAKLTPQDLSNNTVLTVHDDGLIHYSHYIERLLGHVGVTPRYALLHYSHWGDFAQTLASTDEGIGLIHASMARYSMPITSASYRAIPFDTDTMKLRIFLTWRLGDHNPALRPFVDELLRVRDATDLKVYWR